MEQQQQPSLFPQAHHFGTPAHKLTRRGAPSTSFAAASGVDTVTDEAKVYALLKMHGPMTVKEIATLMGKPSINQVSGRLTALTEKGLIEDTGKRRNRCRVMRVA